MLASVPASILNHIRRRTGIPPDSIKPGNAPQSCVASWAAGARLWYLPPYSPDLNPIEQAFAKIKHWMRAAQKRTVDELWRHIGGLVSQIQAPECSNYFANAGYASIKP
jgi:transposase